jgi:NADH:quinone reductase (non-electrogenic)
MTNSRRSVLILGAGFAGLGAAEALDHALGDDGECDITLVDQNNFSLFTPMLPEVAGGQVDPGSIVVSPRQVSPRTRFVQGRVETIDATNRNVTIATGEGAGVPPAQRELHADHLVIALGSVTNFHHIRGLREHAVGIKTIDDAQSLRNRAIALLERADDESGRDARRALLCFVVGGGGFSGVETMAALNDMVRDLVADYRHIDRSDIRMVLVHAQSRLLPEVDEGLADYAQRELERRGVEVVLSTEIDEAGDGWVQLKGKTTERIGAHTLVWAGGVKPNPVIDAAGLKLGRHGGIVVDGCCRVPDHPGLWALGDCAEVPRPNGKSGATYAPTAQNATREGAQVARNILAVLHDRQPEPFVYHPIGELAVVGRRAAVASIYGVRFSGFVAWLLWHAIYLAKLPRRSKRVRVGIDWMLDALGGREIAALPGAGADGQANHE